MAQENYIEGCSMQRPPLLEPNGFCFWKFRFETYVKSKDSDLWQVIQNGDFYYEVEDSKTKLMKETPYKLLEDDQKKKLGKNNEAKMTFYNALPRKEYEHVFMCKTAKEVWHTLIITHQAKVTREQTSDDSDSQEGSDEEVYGEEVKAFNLLVRNFHKFFHRGNGSDEEINLVMVIIDSVKAAGHFASECRKPKEKKDFVKGEWNDSEDDDEHQNDTTCLMTINSQEVVSKPSSSNIDLNIIDLQKENEELLKFNNDFTKTFEKLLNEKRSLERYSQTSKSYIALNKKTMRIAESLNVTFDERLPEPETYPSVEDDRIDEPIVQDLNRSSSLQVNVSNEGYPKSLKEDRGHPMEQVIGELNERTLRYKTKQA
ncbi:hypothetical protein Tco_0140288 [Tanacetum coccineum]